MPRFFFHVFNGHGETPDDEGLDIEDQAGARRIALESVRSMVAEDAKQGIIDLNGHIEVKDAADNLLLRVNFAEAFQLRLPAERNLDRA
jgi:hypothetical protein